MAARVQIKNMALTVVGVYLDADIGFKGVELKKLASIGAFVEVTGGAPG